MSGEFPRAAAAALGDTQLRANLRRATGSIRARRAAAVGEVDDWERLRAEGARIRDEALAGLDRHLERLEREVVAAGGRVHWAPDADAANAIVVDLVEAAGAEEVIKSKSMATDEIGLVEALAAAGIGATESDLAEMIVQLAGDRPSHILVPAIHRNRAEIRDLFAAKLGIEGLSDEPRALAEAARGYLRERFLGATVGITGANFAVAESGAVCVVESEGNARMCQSLTRTLITVMGIEKVIPRFEDLGTMLPLLARSSTGERMNPCTSIWRGVEDDGPREFHLVLLDNGRTRVLADAVGREALRCIRCSACLNVCPVYERVGGHAYGGVYPGPIGAILEPQLSGLREGASLPWASSLCGACEEVCPVGIEIPRLLVHMRGRARREAGEAPRAERAAMAAVARAFASTKGYERAQRALRAAGRAVARDGRIDVRAPGLSAWTRFRDLPAPPERTFREWWRGR